MIFFALQIAYGHPTAMQATCLHMKFPNNILLNKHDKVGPYLVVQEDVWYHNPATGCPLEQQQTNATMGETYDFI